MTECTDPAGVLSSPKVLLFPQKRNCQSLNRNLVLDCPSIFRIHFLTRRHNPREYYWTPKLPFPTVPSGVRGARVNTAPFGCDGGGRASYAAGPGQAPTLRSPLDTRTFFNGKKKKKKTVRENGGSENLELGQPAAAAAEIFLRLIPNFMVQKILI